MCACLRVHVCLCVRVCASVCVCVPGRKRGALLAPLRSSPDLCEASPGEPKGPEGQRSCQPAQLPQGAQRMEVARESGQLDALPRDPSNSRRILTHSLE